MLQDIFLVEIGIPDKFLLYAPKHMALMAINGAGAKAFVSLKQGGLSQGADQINDLLQESGLLDEPLPIDTEPTRSDLTLCPTFRCSLCCTYCFSNGGVRQTDLTLEMAKKAIDLALSRYPTDQIDSSRLTWHGGGESTMAFQVMKEASYYHRRRCCELGITPILSIVSNGVWPPSVKRWIIAEMDRISISCDGPADIQDLQRPLVNGTPSSTYVFQTLRDLAEAGVDFGIRATITEHNVRRMPEMVDFFHGLCGVKSLQFERLTVCGRCEESQIQAGTALDYVTYFRIAFERACELGINLGCSGVRIFRRTRRFCGAAGRTLCVTPEGLLTTCHRVDNRDDPLAGEFIYGEWSEGGYSWDEQRLQNLQSRLAVENLGWCQDCFCKYTCAGGCAASRFSETGSIGGQQSDDRCFIIRELTRLRLVHLAGEKGLLGVI